MTSTRFTIKGAVYLILEKDGNLLFLRRYNTGWQNGKYTLPAGHLDGNETIADCMARETREETGIYIDPNNLKVILTVHHIDVDEEYIDFYLTTNNWEGIPRITEPEKCDDIQWFPSDNLPENVLQNVRAAIVAYKKGETFSEFRWEVNKI